MTELSTEEIIKRAKALGMDVPKSTDPKHLMEYLDETQTKVLINKIQLGSGWLSIKDDVGQVRLVEFAKQLEQPLSEIDECIRLFIAAATDDSLNLAIPEALKALARKHKADFDVGLISRLEESKRGTRAPFGRDSKGQY